MDPQVLFGGEAFPAVLAGEGSLPCVHALVRLQVTRLREAFPALSAAVRSLARVHAHVRLQAPRRGEALVAEGAGEAPVPAEPAGVQRVQPGSTEAQERRRLVRFQIRPKRDWHHARQDLVGPQGAQVQLRVVRDRSHQARALFWIRGAGQRGGASPRHEREAFPHHIQLQIQHGVRRATSCGP